MKKPLFLAFLALAAAASADPLQMPSYSQEVQLSPAPDPAAVTVEAAPLYRDAEWAVTQRWDDNLVDSLRVRDLLKRYHMHGTFYLNASDAWYFNESNYRFEGDPKQDLAKALLKGGNSIGGHTLTHNFVPMLNRQEQFFEILGVRIDREVNSQSPISSFVFPFTVFRNALEGDEVHRDIAAELRRAGYIHVSNQYFNMKLKNEETGILDSWLLPCDGEPGLDANIRGLLKSEKQREKEGNFCFCMHAWPHSWGGPALPNLDAVLKKWKGHGGWWYANQNELAAYRYQNLYSQPVLHLDPPSASSGQASGPRVVVRRFEGWSLGDNVPLTLKVRGYSEAPEASSHGQALKVSRSREKGVWLVELPQEAGHGVPEAYEWHRNSANRSEGLEEKGRGGLQGLASRLHFDGQALHLRFKAQDELQDLRVTWRVPLAWEQPEERRLGDWPAGKSLDEALTLVSRHIPLNEQGRPYFAAQLDFLRKGQRVRLYSDCRGPSAVHDPQFPNGGFLVMGPLPGDRKDFNVDLFASKVLRRKHPVHCQTLYDDVQGCWSAEPTARLDPLHPELAPAGAVMAPRAFYTWDPSLYYTGGRKVHYLMATNVISPEKRMVGLVFQRGVRRIYVNGIRARTRRVELQAGTNLITLLYRPGVPDGDGQGTFSEKNYGTFFRIVDDVSRKRLTDIRYEMPDWLNDKPENKNPALGGN